VPTRILVIDDDTDMCDQLRLELESAGYAVAAATSAPAALDRVGTEEFDVLISDLVMPDMNGFSLCERAIGLQPGLPVILLTAQSTVEMVTRAMRAGAFDFITKPIDSRALAFSVARAARHRLAGGALKRLPSVVGGPGSAMVGQCPSMKRVYELIARVASSDVSVLLQGETGTGKELIARAIHAASLRKGGPFVALNCAAVPSELLESELFGHARGAFTDAQRVRKGLVLQADGGTLLLDEIGELPLQMQPKLLRALQERRVRPVGSDTEVAFDVRVVTATNRDLDVEMSEKRFREDLYYRLNVVRIDVPPLRERAEDVIELALHILAGLAKHVGRALTLSAPAAESLVAYRWPGNVRELQNCLESAVALARFDQITVEDLPARIGLRSASRPVAKQEDHEVPLTMDEVQRQHVGHVLDLAHGNKALAAQMLGVDRRTIYRWLDRQTKLAVA
jgi:two-component system, NtrC family, response regulator HydG